MDENKMEVPLPPIDHALLTDIVRRTGHLESEILQKKSVFNAANSTFMATIVGFGGLVWATLDTQWTDRERALLPIVVLAPLDIAGNTILAVRNVGFGPSLNGQTKEMPPAPADSLEFNHRTALGAGQVEKITLVINNNPLVTLSTDGGDVTTTSQVKTTIAGSSTKTRNICTSYQNAQGEWYETWQTLRVHSDLSIEFGCLRKLSTPSTPCTQEIKVACPKLP